jgi:hypothetical protein
MADAVRPLVEAAGQRLQAVDVDADPALKARHGWDVPLLFDGDVEICRHQLNLPALREWLYRNSGPS